MLHHHRCPRCQWNWICACPEPDEHHGFCFECSHEPREPQPEPQSTLNFDVPPPPEYPAEEANP